MALEMLQTSKGSTAIFAGERLSVSGALLLDFGRFLVLHNWGLGILGEREGKEFDALWTERGKKELWGLAPVRGDGSRGELISQINPVKSDASVEHTESTRTICMLESGLGRGTTAWATPRSEYATSPPVRRGRVGTFQSE